MQQARPFIAPRHDQWEAMRVMWRRRWIFFGCIAAGMIAAGIYLLVATKAYHSSAVVHVQQRTTKVVNDPDTGESIDGNYIATQCELIRSSAVVSAAVVDP